MMVPVYRPRSIDNEREKMIFEKDRRLGQFSITAQFLESDRDVMQILFKDCTILKCEFNPGKDAFEYLAHNPHFAIIDVGAPVPEYKAEFGKSWNDDDHTARPVLFLSKWNKVS